MRRAGILFGWRPVANVAVDNDQRRAVCRLLEVIESFPQQIQVVGVRYALHVPPVGKEASRHVFRESKTGMSLDGDVIVVIDPTKVRKAQVTCQRSGFSAYALHHAPVARKGIHIKIKQLEIRLVISMAKPVAS